jgi:hypothetical protein
LRDEATRRSDSRIPRRRPPAPLPPRLRQSALGHDYDQGVASDRYDTLPREVQRVIDRFFDSRESGLLTVFGPSEDDPLFVDRAPNADPATPLIERLQALQRTLLDHLDLFVRQSDEIDLYGDEYAQQLRGEALATLIALRELWRFAPEITDSSRVSP